MDADKGEQPGKGAASIWYEIARKMVVFSAISAGIISVLMIANYLQTKTNDPLNSQVITQLISQLQDNPEDEVLKEQIRALDLLARKAYFTYQWQIRTGSYLLLAFVLLLLLSLKFLYSLQPHLPDLNEAPRSEERWENRLLSRKYVLIGGLGVFLLALILGLLSQSELENAGPVATAEAQSTDFASLEEKKVNWPGFRGPEGNGVAAGAEFPTVWDGASGENILWKTPIPHPGYNSPIIWGKRIFLSGADDGVQIVYCLDADTGEILWQTELTDVPGSSGEQPDVSYDTGHAASTMTTDGVRVFVLFSTGDIAGLDMDGNIIWAKNLGVPDNHYGHASSLTTFQDLLIVPFDQNTGGRLIALRTTTGALVYDQPREVGISWGSPILVNTGERFEVILNGNPFVMAHDPLTGQELWRVQCMLGEVAPSPAYADGMVYAVNEYARLVGITVQEEPNVVWENLDDLSEVSSPVATDELVFVATSFGTVSCFDGKTGERYWYNDFPEGFYSSPILVGDNVYALDVLGTMSIFKAGKEFELIAQNELGEPAMTVPAFMHNRIYIRGEHHLYCIGT